MMAELAPLKLDKARFRVAVRTLEPQRFTAAGGDAVEFEVKTNPGAEWGGLGVIASGGELARFALALKAALATRGGDDAGAPVMIFDEVDQGVGGRGRRCRRLAAETTGRTFPGHRRHPQPAGGGAGGQPPQGLQAGTQWRHALDGFPA
ncbi:MAG: hypothetical protein WDN06_17595 [Asticcacaulis sp.]